MTFSKFIETNLGRKVDFDGVYGPQCVDLFRRYHKDVIGGEHTGSVDGAWQLWDKFSDSGLPSYYYRKNISVARTGDVVIFAPTPSNEFGHVAILVSWIDHKRMLVLEQDGFRKDGCKLTVRKNTGTLGCLVPKKEVAFA